jgi:hypothetical protein
VTVLNLVPTDSLSGATVALSVSESADLARLGLDDKHAEYAIAEIARAVLTAGGNLAYGGRIRPSGFTQFLMHELRRYGAHGHRLTICVAHPEHRKLPLSELKHLDQTLEPSCRLRFLDADGTEVDYRSGRDEAPAPPLDPDDTTAAYSAMRRDMTRISQARVVVGGKLAGFRGAMPGIVEEAIDTLEASHPLYVAGGFGGAAALVARTLDLGDASWLPDGVPDHEPGDPSIADALSTLRTVAADHGEELQAGLEADEVDRLTWSHRPGDIAAMLTVGLSRALDR